MRADGRVVLAGEFRGPTPIRDTSAQDRPLARKHRRAPIAAAAVAISIIASIYIALRWSAGERSISSARVRFAEVTRGTFTRDATVNGRVVAAVSPTLYAPMPGTVTLQIHAGDTVKKGAVLARIDSPELTNELDRERSTLRLLAAQVGGARIAADTQRVQARREADEAEIALTAATRELERAEAAFQGALIPELEYLRAKDALATARVREQNAKAIAALAVKSARFELETAEQHHERQRLAVANLERRVGELTVRAPVDGIVGTLSVSDRAVVVANAPLMTLVDLSRLEVELVIPESYADDLGLGMKAEIKIGTATAAGTISALSPEVVDHHVIARMRFEGGQPSGLRQSQRVPARILIDERAGVVSVPRGSYLEAHGGRHIYVVEDDLAVRRAIRIGASSVSAIEILEGLKPGERVVIAGSEGFKDAATIRIND